jgi:hypothetical protein
VQPKKNREQLQKELQEALATQSQISKKSSMTSEIGALDRSTAKSGTAISRKGLMDSTWHTAAGSGTGSLGGSIEAGGKGSSHSGSMPGPAVVSSEDQFGKLPKRGGQAGASMSDAEGAWVINMMDTKKDNEGVTEGGGKSKWRRRCGGMLGSKEFWKVSGVGGL